MKKYHVWIEDIKIYYVEVDAESKVQAKVLAPEVLRMGKGSLVEYKTRIKVELTTNGGDYG